MFRIAADWQETHLVMNEADVPVVTKRLIESGVTEILVRQVVIVGEDEAEAHDGGVVLKISLANRVPKRPKIFDYFRA